MESNSRSGIAYHFRIAGFIALCTMMSCNPDRVFESHTDPSGNLEWKREKAIVFDIEIIDTSSKYNFFLALRFATGYAYSWCDVEVTEKGPDDKVKKFDFRFRTLDESGYTGDGAGDIYDLEAPWRTEYKFSLPGKYHYEIVHTMNENILHMVMEVGMIVDKVSPPK